MKRSLLVSLALLPLAGCSWLEATPPIDDGEQTSSVRETNNVIYRGRLLPLGASIYMEGSHRLELEDGRFILLESDGLVLDDYLNLDVEAFGATRPTVEGGGIIMRVERVAELAESSSSEASSIESSSSSDAISSAAMSSRFAVSSIAPVSRASSIAPVTPSSAPAPASSAAAVSSASDAVSIRAATMAKANMAVANWTQQYCSTHIEFCVPVHKNWYYVSFGATSSSLWHVEMSNEEIVALGDGPITVVLHSGAAPAADGHVTIEGGVVTGIRAWTNNRHFTISAPAVLESAVRHITQELRSAPASSSSASQ